MRALALLSAVAGLFGGGLFSSCGGRSEGSAGTPPETTFVFRGHTYTGSILTAGSFTVTAGGAATTR